MRLAFETLAELLAYVCDAMYIPLGATRATRDCDRTLKWVARRLEGHAIPAGRDRIPAIQWDLEKTTGLLYLPVSASGAAEGVLFRIRQGAAFRLRLHRETAWTRFRRFLGSQDVDTGDETFDRTFIVQTTDPTRARALLTRDARSSLLILAAVAPVSLDLGPQGIVIRTTHDFRNELDRLTRFAGEALTLGRALLQTLDPSVALAEVEARDSSLCPVCSTSVVEHRALCARCRTPHHKDCWKFQGGCAMYACAGRPDRLRALPERGRAGAHQPARGTP